MAMNDYTTIQMATDSIRISPLEALMAHFNASPKSVQRAFAKFIIDNRANDLEVARQKAMVRQSLTQAFMELKNNEARPVEDLLDEL